MATNEKKELLFLPIMAVVFIKVKRFKSAPCSSRLKRIESSICEP